MKALILGSTLMSTAQGASDESRNEIDYTPFMVTGAALLAFGAIYVGQLVQQASSCCLRRIRAWAGRRTTPGGTTKGRNGVVG